MSSTKGVRRTATRNQWLDNLVAAGLIIKHRSGPWIYWTIKARVLHCRQQLHHADAECPTLKQKRFPVTEAYGYRTPKAGLCWHCIRWMHENIEALVLREELS